MASLSRLEDALWLINTIANLAIVVRLMGLGLNRVYRAFFAYMIFRVVRAGGLRCFDPSREAYGWFWLMTEPVVWVLFGYAVFELTSVALREYRGLASVGRKGLVAALGLSVAVSVATLCVDLSQSPGDFPVLLACNLARRAIWSTLSLYLLLLAGFLLWYPVPINRNLLLHTALLTLYSLADTALLFVRNLLGPSVIPQVSTALVAASTVCSCAWLGLTRAGESRPGLARLHWRPETERHMLEQLSVLNATLARSAGREPRQAGR